MGWFSSDPKVREVSNWGRIEWKGQCEECGKSHSDSDKARAIRKIKECAEKDKKNKAAQDREDERKAKKKSDEALRKRKKKAEKLYGTRKNKARQLRRIAKEKCPTCGKKPCKGTYAKCASRVADSFESSMEIDVSNPATFDEQLAFYEKMTKQVERDWRDYE